MDIMIDQSSSRVPQYDEDPSALTGNCDYPLPSQVSAKFCYLSLELGFGTELLTKTSRLDLHSVRSYPNRKT